MVATGINLSTYPESPWPGRLLRMIGSEVPKDLWHQMLPTTKTLVRVEFPLRDGGVAVMSFFSLVGGVYRTRPLSVCLFGVVLGDVFVGEEGNMVDR